MDTFQALSDPNRRQIIEMIAKKGQLSASDIYGEFDVSPPAISQHLQVLRKAKLVDMEKRAQSRIYTLNKEGISDIEDWVIRMKKMWNKRFDRLDKALSEAK